MRALQATSHAISEQGLKRVAPAIFASFPHHKTTKRYTFIPTIEIVRALKAEGWYPSYVAQSYSRTAEGAMTSKHQIRFRRSGVSKTLKEVGDSFFEIALTNAHDTASAYIMDAGVFKLACSNGMLVRDAVIQALRIMHVSNARELAVNNLHYMTNHQLPRVEAVVSNWSRTRVKYVEQLEIAQEAHKLRWGEGNAPVDYKSLLPARRHVDQDDNLWSVFNRVQENVMKGGMPGRTANNRRTTVRGISSIDAANKINRKLWEFAGRYAQAA